MLLLQAAAAVSCRNAVHRVGLPCARTARPAPKGSSGAAAAQGPPASSKRRILDTETSRVVLTIKACKQRNRTTQSRWVPLASLTRENQSNQCEIDACVPAERIPKARGAGWDPACPIPTCVGDTNLRAPTCQDLACAHHEALTAVRSHGVALSWV